MAVFPEGDGWSSVACTKGDDGRCWGELGNLDTGVKEEKPAIRAGGGWPALSGRGSRLPGPQTTKCMCSAIGMGGRCPSVWAVWIAS